jgi:hypothetical protein
MLHVHFRTWSKAGWDFRLCQTCKALVPHSILDGKLQATGGAMLKLCHKLMQAAAYQLPIIGVKEAVLSSGHASPGGCNS